MSQERTLLIDEIRVLLPAARRLDFQNLVKKIGRGPALDYVTVNATYAQEVTEIVDAGIRERWIHLLVTELTTVFSNSTALGVLRERFKPEVTPTSKSPFEEVLLDGDRPFVNRRSLRNALLRLADDAGERMLLVDGPPQSGKSFSQHLLFHAAVRHRFDVQRFELSALQDVKALAEAVMLSLDDKTPLAEQGTESAERWAEKLASIAASAIRRRKAPLFLIFDQFPASPPPETLSFIVRLARHADEDLRDVLRIVLVKFPNQLPAELDDVAAREVVEPFTATDMMAAMKQISTARGWAMDEAKLKKKIDDYEAQGTRTLRERFRFLREMILKFAAAPGGDT